MVTEKQVIESLRPVFIPGVNRSLVQLNMVSHIELSDNKVDIKLASTALSESVQNWLKGQVETIRFPGVKEVNVSFIEAKPPELNQIKKVVAVMSGKGGVGKSLIAGLLGVFLRRKGYEAGILDADITGPSIPKIFGVTDRPYGSQTGILPVLSRSGIELMSINLLLPEEDSAVIWRGPLIANTIRQFWEEVLWGKLDYLIIDLPPGTSDASLTVAQALPLAGVVIVLSPQELAVMVVKKAVSMVRQMNIPILGVIENMSYFVVPETGKQIEIFGQSRGEEMAQAAGAPLLGKLPIDPALSRLCDAGNIEQYESEALNILGDAFLKAVPVELERK